MVVGALGLGVGTELWCVHSVEELIMRSMVGDGSGGFVANSQVWLLEGRDRGGGVVAGRA